MQRAGVKGKTLRLGKIERRPSQQDADRRRQCLKRTRLASRHRVVTRFHALIADNLMRKDYRPPRDVRTCIPSFITEREPVPAVLGFCENKTTVLRGLT